MRRIQTPDTHYRMVDFLSEFNDDEYCLSLIFKIKYGDNYICPKCNRQGFFKKVKSRKAFQCTQCNFAISPMAGTIFQKTTTPLSLWLQVLYFMATSKHAITARDIERKFPVCYKTAHRIGKRLRQIFLEIDTELVFSGVIEIDEAFFAKGSRWTRWGGVTTRKSPVMGIMERGGKVQVIYIKDRNQKTLNREIEKRVKKGSTIYTDGWLGYKALKKNYNHQFVNHSSGEYARGDIHTNNIENFWGRAKRQLRGHVQISQKYLPQYMAEVVYKHNYRNLSGEEKFRDLLKRIVINKEFENINVVLMKVVA